MKSNNLLNAIEDLSSALRVAPEMHLVSDLWRELFRGDVQGKTPRGNVRFANLDPTRPDLTPESTRPTDVSGWDGHRVDFAPSFIWPPIRRSSATAEIARDADVGAHSLSLRTTCLSLVLVAFNASPSLHYPISLPGGSGNGGHA